MKTARFVFPLLAILSGSVQAGGPILQYFESRWETIEKKTPDAFVAGYGAFWLPPPSKADSGGWSVGYDVYDRFNLGTPFDQTLYGTEAGAKQMVRTAHRAGLNVYFDFVGNHNGYRTAATPGFVEAGDYPGFAVSLPGDVDGDFHSAYAGGDWDMRVAGLIDIAQEKNHQFIRNPVGPDSRNIPNEQPRAENARFYPDLQLPANSLGIHPFNIVNPPAGDPVVENATGLLLRNAQWMLETIGADGFRLDATKHMPDWFFSGFYDNVMYRRGRPDLSGNPTTPFSFGENFNGNFDSLKKYVRKDGFGNRDTLDFPLFFAMKDLFNAGGYGDMRSIENASFDAWDGNANDGTYGVTFVQSHDTFGPSNDNVAYAYILTRAGLPIVYYNAKEFGNGRDFPKDGRGDSLGGDYGNLMPRIVDTARRLAKGAFTTRWIDGDTFVYERDNSLLVGINDRADAGYDERTVLTNFRNVTLVELSGNADDSNVNANNDIFRTVTVGNDGYATIRVPRNKTNSNAHKRGFVMYGLATPIQSQTISPVAQVLAPESNTLPNGARRITPLQVVTANTFSIAVQTSASGVAEDNALVKLDGGTAIDANPGLAITSGEFAGFEEFTGSRSPRNTGGSGLYNVTVDAQALSEGMHFVETIAFTPRPDGSPATYSSNRAVIYLDRVPPPVTLAYPSTTGTTDVQSQNYTIVTNCPDFTADSMHVFVDQPVVYNFLANANSSNKLTRVDRNEFRWTWNNPQNGQHSLTVLAFEQTGNYSITRFETVGVQVPQPHMAMGIDIDGSASSVNFQSMPASVTERMYPSEFVVRVDSTGGLQFPRDYDVSLEVDGQIFPASPYNSSLLPPKNRLVENDQNLGDQFNEFRFLWRGFGTGNHNFIARAKLKSMPELPNELSAMVNVPTSVTGPNIFITAPSAGASYNHPATLSVSLGTDFSAASVLTYISNGETEQLIGSVNSPPSTSLTFEKAVTNSVESDALTGLNLGNGVHTIRAVAATGYDGTGLQGVATTTISITGMPAPPADLSPVIDGNITEFFTGPAAAVSGADGRGSSQATADFGADGSLTELRPRVWNDILYVAVRGDIFNGTDQNQNATIVYIDVDSTSGTGAKKLAPGGELSDTGNHLRSVAGNSGFELSGSLKSQGRGFDAAVVVDGSSPLSSAAFGFGSGGVAGSPGSFAQLQASIAFGRGLESYPGASGTTIAGPSGFEIAIPLSQLGNPDPRNIAFEVVTTSDGAFPSPNTLPENAQNTFDALQILDSTANMKGYEGSLVINEVGNGPADYVELYRSNAAALPLNGWWLQWSDAAAETTAVSLPGAASFGGGYAVFYDSSSTVTPGGTVYNLAVNVPWEASRSGSVALLDPYGIAVDYTRWKSLAGQTHTESVPAGTEFDNWSVGFDSGAAQPVSLSRDANSNDTNRSNDFSVMQPTPGARNQTSAVMEWELY